ncbi:MAG TPA: hypothetical protein VNA17_12050 [Pyrinomonadaceae bacterium]|nr:hypothetical protein [Pyrinomonadaceae bacterium]
MKILIMAAAAGLSLASNVVAHHCADGAKVVMPSLSAEARQTYESKLAEARKQAENTPNDADAIIWLGRRTAYLGEYKNAIKIFTGGIKKHPTDARMYRHRGHRYITIRCFDDAIRDFEEAAKLIRGKPDEIEPDGLPNAKNIPTSTLQSNIWYHLGLAYYLKSDFKNALRAYVEADKVSTNNDMRVATAHWHYMTLRRLGREAAARKILEPFTGQVEIIENTDYLKLIELYRGKTVADELLKEIGGEAKTLGSASLGYGLGNWYLYNGDKAKAAEIFRRITAGDQWASFGFIAAEAELRFDKAKSS